MKANYEAYPEVLFVDATYKLLDTWMPVYLLIVEGVLRPFLHFPEVCSNMFMQMLFQWHNRFSGASVVW